MLELFHYHINKQFPFLTNSRLLLAVSGGLDSIALLHLTHKLRFEIEVAHCNFQLRAAESNNDEAFVQNLCSELGLPFHCKRFDTELYAKQNKVSIQMAARDLRYEWFDELIENSTLNYILTAHHLDDSLETFLINISRGTGIEGLKGIPRINGNIVRPMLDLSREQIKQYAHDNKLNWREDSSNQSDKYLRNHMRLNVIPELKKVNPDLLENFKSTIEHISSVSEILNTSIKQIEEEVISYKDDLIYFDIQKLKKYQPINEIVFQLFKKYGFRQWNDIIDLFDSQSGKQVFSEDWRLLKDRKHLILAKNKDNALESIEILESDSEVRTKLGTLKFQLSSQISKNGNNTISVDRSKLTFPLTVRMWQDGDRFFPFGMDGSKKVSKFLKDEKFSLLEKEQLLLLCSGEEIIWLIGKRFDRRFMVTDNTEQIINISLE